jgi:hypothetical protein
VDRTRHSTARVSTSTAPPLEVGNERPAPTALLGELADGLSGAGSPQLMWRWWRGGLAPSTAREQLWVAVRLRELPEVMARFATGTLSYSKVRAITRIAVPELQQLLLAWADHATGADLDRIARGVSRARRASQVDPDRCPPMGLELTFDDDAAVITLRLPTDEGLEVHAALQRLADTEQALQQAELQPGQSLPPTSRAQQLAEIAVAVILAGNAQTPPDTSGLDRHTLIVELDAEDLTRTDRHVPVQLTGQRLPAISATALRRHRAEHHPQRPARTAHTPAGPDHTTLPRKHSAASAFRSQHRRTTRSG